MPSSRPGSKIGGPSGVESLDPWRVDVGDGEVVAEPGEPDRGHEADMAGANQEQVHGSSVSPCAMPPGRAGCRCCQTQGRVA